MKALDVAINIHIQIGVQKDRNSSCSTTMLRTFWTVSGNLRRIKIQLHKTSNIFRADMVDDPGRGVESSACIYFLAEWGEDCGTVNFHFHENHDREDEAYIYYVNITRN